MNIITQRNRVANDLYLIQERIDLENRLRKVDEIAYKNIRSGNFNDFLVLALKARNISNKINKISEILHLEVIN